jgi:hypothetical protein
MQTFFNASSKFWIIKIDKARCLIDLQALPDSLPSRPTENVASSFKFVATFPYLPVTPNTSTLPDRPFESPFNIWYQFDFRGN